MKKIVTLFILFITVFGFSQVPDSFSYRSVVFERDSIPLQNEEIIVEVRILDSDGEKANELYAETHQVTTNDRGMFYVQIGTGNAKREFKDLTDVLWTEEGEKYVGVEVKSSDDSVLSYGVSQLMSVPYALVAKEVIGGNQKSSATEVFNLDSLRINFPSPVHGDLVYVKGHTVAHDGGEGFFTFDENYEYEENDGDDKGIIIKPEVYKADREGRWLRSFDGHINVNFYGITGGGNEDPTITSVSDRIQLIIEYAAANGRHENNILEPTKGNTIFFPNGQYILDKPLRLKSGISIIGEGDYTLFTAAPNANYDYMFKNEQDPAQGGGDRFIIHLEKFVVNGRYCTGNEPGQSCNQPAQVGGMFFRAFTNETNTGGIQRSKLKNIQIVNMWGHGIYLLGGFNSSQNPDFNLPNQHNVFENVMISRKTDNGNALRLEGQQTENIFIRCVFDGNRIDHLSTPDVIIDNEITGQSEAAGRSNGNIFLNCGFGTAQTGVLIKGAEDITFESCWFENTFTAFDVQDARKITISNSRFANAGGYGSLHDEYPTVPGGDGECVRVTNSSVNIERNYVITSSIKPDSLKPKMRFVRGLKATGETYANNTIVLRDNDFKDPILSKSFGVVQYTTVSNGKISIGGKKQVFVDISGNVNLNTIDSHIGSGEVLYLRANSTGGTGNELTIHSYGTSSSNGENIHLGGQATLTLKHSQWAAFIKVDNPLSNSALDTESCDVCSTYQLVATGLIPTP